MLSTDGAAGVGAYSQDFRTQFVDPLQFIRVPFVKHNQGVKISITGMEYISDGKIIFLSGFHHLCQHLRQFRAGNRTIAAHIARPHLTNRTEGSFSACPEDCAFSFVFGQFDFSNVVTLADFHDQVGFFIHAIRHTVQFDNQHTGRIQGVAHLNGFLHSLHDNVVHHLQGGRNNSFGYNFRNRIGAVFDGFIDRQHGFDRFRRPNEF